MEAPGIDPGTSRMLSERSTIWATPPDENILQFIFDQTKFFSINFFIATNISILKMILS